MVNATVKEFFHAQSSTLTYVVSDAESKDAVIIDSVVDYSNETQTPGFGPVEAVHQHVKENGLHVRALLETHVHADHLSGARALKNLYFRDAPLYISERILEVQRTYSTHDDVKGDWKSDGSQFDRLTKDGDIIQAGTLSFTVLQSPGHTPSCVVYLCGDKLFTGDVLFMPDFGTGRCDFPGGSAEQLYDSIKRLYDTLPDTTRVFVGHDYQPGGRPLAFESTLAVEKASNVHLKAITTKDEFVAFRRGRDATLPPPKMLLPSLRANVVGGAAPPS